MYARRRQNRSNNDHLWVVLYAYVFEIWTYYRAFKFSANILYHTFEHGKNIETEILIHRNL